MVKYFTMNKITIWPQQTIPESLIKKLLDFYKDQNPRDIFNKRIHDLKGMVPQYEDVPELYDFLESLGYEFIDKNWNDGNYLETNENYGIHADTGKDQTHTLDSTSFLIPLYMEPKCHSYLFFLNQVWNGEATTFVRQPWLQGWNYQCSDYSDPRLEYLDPENWDDRLDHIMPQLEPATREGMSIDSIYKWKIGSFVSFPNNRMHFAVTNSNIPKIGLAIRLKCKT